MLNVNKKYIYILLPLILLIIGGAVTLYLINKKKSEEKAEIRGVVLKNAVAIPVDAIALYSFRNISFVRKDFMDTTSLFPRFVKNDNGLLKLIKNIDKACEGTSSLKEAAESEVLFSLHYSAKNELSLLFCLDLSNVQIDKEQFKKSILKAYNVSRSHLFNGVEIFDMNTVQFSIYKNIFIASTSPIVLESSIRHLLSNTSIMDNSEFSKILSESVNEDNMLFINSQNIGKIFSGVIDRKFWGFSDFFSKFSSWTTLNGEFNSDFQSYSGEVTNLKGVGNYSSCYKSLDGDEPEVMKVLPHNTFGILTLPLGDFKSFLGSYREYKELYKKLNPLSLDENQKWFLSLDPEEVSLAAIPYGGVIKWVTLLKSGKRSSSDKGKVERFDHKGALADLFGGVFKNTSDEAFCRTDGWIVIGSQDIIKDFANGTLLKFTMDEYFDQSEIYDRIVKDNTLLSIVVNVSSQPDSLASLFKPIIKGLVSNRLKQRNFEVISCQFNSVESGVDMNLLLYASQMEKLPAPKREDESKPAGWQLDTIVHVPTGPFELKKFNNGSTEYLEQLPNFKLRLLDKDKKGVWAVPFSTPIRGYVALVDYFRNQKQQMLFASGNQLYLLDRLGRFVNPYPKKVDSLVMLGPKTYDIKDDGDFAIMLLHTDNALRLYDRDCRHYPAFSAIRTTEIIKEFPELIKVGRNKFWVLRTHLQTIIYTINGNPVAKFVDKNVLSPTTKVKIVSEAEVAVTTNAGKDVILNLENGKIKRYRK